MRISKIQLTRLENDQKFNLFLQTIWYTIYGVPNFWYTIYGVPNRLVLNQLNHRIPV